MDDRAKKVVEELEGLATDAGYASMAGFGDARAGGKYEAYKDSARIVRDAFGVMEEGK